MLSIIPSALSKALIATINLSVKSSIWAWSLVISVWSLSLSACELWSFPWRFSTSLSSPSILFFKSEIVLFELSPLSGISDLVLVFPQATTALVVVVAKPIAPKYLIVFS
ncbi:hypothetical protein CP520_00805 [Mesoplasma lactucae ATCC 49193]|uniref:Uncharacterized protein n=1 Tax=Mesoplasma lactucae ATCC 49193 TaxID=81460 RepID=A0A291IR82_9MOLU|nr:hypothetical protein CP520_00805 [Mesoplasma lactucae ATCC 49193]